MARPRAFNEAAALAAIEDVFWRKGFEGASYADLMAASGLGKGSLYAAFGDKAALYLAALRAYIDREIGRLGAILLDAARDGRERLTAALNIAVDAAQDASAARGCFLCNAAIEKEHLSAEVRELITQTLRLARNAFTEAAIAAGGDGADGANMLAVYLGLQVLSRSGAPIEALVETKDAALRRFA